VLECSKEKGYKYKDADLRWRHVGRNADEKCYLFDLESLMEVDDAGEIDVEVQLNL
jgi:hypothetical protein